MKLLSDDATYRIDADPEDESRLTATFRIRPCPSCPHGPYAELPHIWTIQRFDGYEFSGPPKGLHTRSERHAPVYFVCWG
jgi:hypothetical protein